MPLESGLFCVHKHFNTPEIAWSVMSFFQETVSNESEINEFRERHCQSMVLRTPYISGDLKPWEDNLSKVID
jgi:hypothetical protein